MLEAIREGTVTLAFRRWDQARVRAGSTFRTALGVVGVTGVDVIELGGITDNEARQAGYDSRDHLVRELSRRTKGQVYRVGLRFEGADPRSALRTRADFDPEEREQLLAKIARLGAKSADGPWAQRTLQLIASYPATRAAELAAMMGVETPRFKTRVRQLKELGLTESLEIGYRLSPRGKALLE
jgi:hypothetical protein